MQELSTGDPDLLDDERGDEALLARIPVLEGSANKARYLSWRASGFSVREAARLTEVTETTIRRWRDTDAEFLDLENKFVRDLSRNLAADLLKMEFLRNMKVALHKDGKVLLKAAGSLDALTEREFEYWKRIRPLYTANELSNLQRALAPEYDESDTVQVSATMSVTVGKQDVDSEEAKRAAAHKLLQRFTVNTQVVLQQTQTEQANGDHPDTLEAEYTAAD